MAYPYQKHIWVTREIIRREYLQNIEDGIYDEQQERLQADAELAQDLADEVSRATNAEDALTTALQAESTRAQTAESAEATRAQSAESNLSNRISAEVTRATEAEESLSNDVDSLDERISNEYTRATNAESSLGTRVSTLETTATRAYKAAGSVLFANLPALASSRQGFVYNIIDAFTTTSDFVEGAGKDYPAGTNVAIVALEGTPITYKYDVMSGFIDTSDFITNTDYATTTTAGIVKPDGVTTSIDANGVISATGGGPAVEKAYKTNDSASTTIDDTDYVPMSTSSETRKKALWSTIIAKIKAALATVATSGSYNDLSNKPNYAGSSSEGGPAEYVSYQSGNEINFKGGKQLRCWFNYRNADTGQTEGTSENIEYFFGNYSATSGKSNLNANSFNGVRLALSGSTPGYYNSSGTFVAFRKPTGNATAAQVLSGYTASNASSDGFSGSMPARSNGTYVDSTNIDGTGPYAYIPYGYYPSYSSNRAYVYFTTAQVQNFHKHTATATPTGSSLNSTAYDLGAYQSYRYVNTAVCYSQGVKHYQTNRSGFVSYHFKDDGSEYRMDLYDVLSGTTLRITTDVTSAYRGVLTVKTISGTILASQSYFDKDHPLEYTFTSTYDIQIIAKRTSAYNTDEFHYWWYLSNSNY